MAGRRSNAGAAFDRGKTATKNNLASREHFVIVVLKYGDNLMKTTQFVLAAILAVGLSAAVWAAPVESVESSRASAAFQKLDAFLGEKVVADQLAALGITRTQVSARLAKLNDTQLEQLAAQVDLIKAGGTIQGSNPDTVGPVDLNPARGFGAFLEQLRVMFREIFHQFFFWQRDKGPALQY
jgi:hypothetical protein